MKGVEDRPVKNYVSPKLTVFGDIRTITQACGGIGNADGGIVPNDRTCA